MENTQKTRKACLLNNRFLRLLIMIYVLLSTVSCQSPVTSDIKERLTVREKIINNSFDVGGIAKQDTVRGEIFVWDTIIKRFNRIDTIQTTFNEATKFQTLKLTAMPDTLRDTIYIKNKNQTKYIKVIPQWAWWCLFIAIIEAIIIIAFIKSKFK